MKVSTLVFISVLIETSVCGGTVDSDFQRAYLNGAKARIELTVHDECGAPVSGASVHVLMGMNYRLNSYDIDGKTDTNGVFVIEGKTTGNEIEIKVTKDGWYRSQKKLCFIAMGHEHAVKNGKWQPWGMKVDLPLRRMGKLSKLLVFASPARAIPSTNRWVGVDLERNDFVKPYGIGESSDVLVKVMWDGLSLDNSKLCYAEVIFPREHDGGYFAPVVNCSDFRYVYFAETNKVEVRSLKIVRNGNARHLSHPTDDRECELIVRLRTELDDRGRVVAANYGAIENIIVSPAWEGNPTIRFVHVFNPVRNDANLEYHE